MLSVKGIVGKTHSFSYNRSDMRKDAPPFVLIEEEAPGGGEARGQEYFGKPVNILEAGVEGYGREGSKFLQRFSLAEEGRFLRVGYSPWYTLRDEFRI